MNKYNTLTAENEFNEGVRCHFRHISGDIDIFYPHAHEYYEIFLTVSGVVNHWINGEGHKLPEGSLVFIRPNDTHGYLYETDESNNTEYVNLSFSKEIARALFNYLSDGIAWDLLLKSKMPATVLLTNDAKNRLLTRLDTLNTINYKDKKAIEMRTKTILADVFSTYFSQRKDYTKTDNPEWLSQLLKEMQEIENFTLGINRMIQLSGKSREHLSRYMKKYVGKSITEYVNGLRINYAANLLINTNIEIIDICLMSGFQNLSYFYKIFKNTYSLSPLQFKNKYTTKGVTS